MAVNSIHFFWKLVFFIDSLEIELVTIIPEQ